MAFYRGEEGSVKFDDAGSSAAAITSTRSWSLTLDKAILETTALQDNYAGKIGSIISGSGSAEVLYTASSGDETAAFVDHINTTKDQGTALFELYLTTDKKSPLTLSCHLLILRPLSVKLKLLPLTSRPTAPLPLRTDHGFLSRRTRQRAFYARR